MVKYKITYSREYTKIVYANNPKEAEWKFNRQADTNMEYISVEEVKEVKN